MTSDIDVPTSAKTDCSLCIRLFTILVTFVAAVLTVVAQIPALPTCFGGDAYTLLSEIVPPCAPIPRGLIDTSLSDVTDACLGEVPAIVNCATTPELGDTRFIDGFDNIFYIIEWIAPGTNARLAVEWEGTVADFLIDVAAAHTTEAHVSGGIVTDACFWVTLPSIAWALLVVAVTIASAIAGGVVIIIMLSQLIYPVIVAAIVGTRAYQQTVDAAAEEVPEETSVVSEEKADDTQKDKGV